MDILCLLTTFLIMLLKFCSIIIISLIPIVWFLCTFFTHEAIRNDSSK